MEEGFPRKLGSKRNTKTSINHKLLMKLNENPADDGMSNHGTVVEPTLPSVRVAVADVSQNASGNTPKECRLTFTAQVKKPWGDGPSVTPLDVDRVRLLGHHFD
jgi:hypothetical protein